jgi:hypothetical protein
VPVRRKTKPTMNHMPVTASPKFAASSTAP